MMWGRERIMARRGRFARAAVLGVGLLLTGCASTEKPPGPATLHPAPQSNRGTSQIVGDAIVASLSGVAVTVRWMDRDAVGRYYAGRPGLVSPWPDTLWQESPPNVFLVRVRNHTHEEAQFDPAMIVLVDQDGKRDRPIPYEEMYMRLAETENAGPRLVSLQATLLSRFLIIQPGAQREGFLLFPTIKAESKHLLLELPSFFVGGRAAPGRFEFQVLRQP
jgi:hypothetical protein